MNINSKSRKISIGIGLVDNKTIQVFNRNFHKVDAETDVLAFNIDEEAPEGYYLLGDVMISIDQVKKNAIQFNATEAEELARVVAHGVLHLLGFEDETVEAKKQMTGVEDQVLKKIFNK